LQLLVQHDWRLLHEGCPALNASSPCWSCWNEIEDWLCLLNWQEGRFWQDFHLRY
jgi:hypothetical protein